MPPPLPPPQMTSLNRIIEELAEHLLLCFCRLCIVQDYLTFKTYEIILLYNHTEQQSITRSKI